MSPKGKEVVVESESQAALEVKSSEGKKVMVESESESEADLEVRSSKGKEAVVESEAELEVMLSKDKEVAVESEAELEMKLSLSKDTEVAVESEAELEMKPLKGKEVVVESGADLEVRSSKGKEVVVESEAELEVMLSKDQEVAVESEAELEVKPSKCKEVVVEFEAKSEVKSSKSKRKNKGKGKGKGKVVDYQAAADSIPKKFVVLRSSDKVEFEVEESLAQRSDMLKDMIEDVAISDGIPLPNITGSVLTKVIEYWKHHAEGVEGSEEMKKWDADFAHCDGDFNKRYDLILAANYLAAKPLLDLLLQAVADAVKDMKVEDMREYLSIENDFTEEEEKVYKDEYAWAFEI